MDRVQQPRRTAQFSRGHTFAGVLLCALVVVFSLAAKVAWYHSESTPAPAISKLKAFKAELPTQSIQAEAVTPVPSAAVPVVVALAALLFFEFLCVEKRNPEPQSRSRDGFFRSTAARPPPAR